METLSALSMKVIDIVANLILSVGLFGSTVVVPPVDTSIVNHRTSDSLTHATTTKTEAVRPVSQIKAGAEIDTGNLLVSTSDDLRKVPGTFNNGHYRPPRTPIIPRKGYTNINPTGADNTYSIEDAVIVARQQGFEALSSSDFKQKLASSTGRGEALFITEWDLYGFAKNCPSHLNAISATFEMNIRSGLVVVTNTCKYVIYD